MANVIGFEQVAVSAVVVEPNNSTTKHAARCALFYLDPRATGPVRWRSDGDPTAEVGIPIYPGDSVVMAGPGNVRDAKFISGDGNTHTLYVVYYDNVDVVQMNFNYGGSAAGLSGSSSSSTMTTNQRLDDILLELKRIRLGTSLMVDEDLEKEF